MNERVLRCACAQEKTLVDGDFRVQQSFDQIECCAACRPELYEPLPRTLLQ